MSGYANVYPRGNIRVGMKRGMRGRYGANKRRRREGTGYDFKGELYQSSRRLGRMERRRGARYVKHLVRTAVQRNIYGMQNWSSYGGTYGAVPIINFYDSVTPRYTLPVHLYDLTCAPNNVGGTTQTAQCGYQLTSSTNTTSGATTTWRALGNAVDVIRAGHTGTSSAILPNTSSLLRAASIKLMLYAPTAIPIKYVIQLVQFTDETFAPTSNIASGSVAAAGTWQAEGTALNVNDATQTSFWLNKLQPYAKSPVVHQFKEGVSKMRVLYSKTIIMNPKETTEVSNTKYHQFNLFKAFNKQCTYAYEPNSLWNILDNSTEQSDTADNKCCIHPTKRVYLMIRSMGNYGNHAGVFPGMDTNITIGGAAAKPYTAYGSYDMSVRLYHDDMGA